MLAKFSYILVCVSTSLFVAFLLMQLFSERPRTHSSASPASHFQVRELVAGRKLTTLSLLCSVPFAALFFVLSLYSTTLATAGKQLLLKKLREMLDMSVEPFEKVLSQLPDLLDQLYVLAVTLLLFAPYVRAPFVLFRNLIFKAISFDDRIDDVAEAGARAALATLKYPSAKNALLSATGSRDAPVAKELINAPDVKRLAYQLLHFSEKDSAKHGLRRGLGMTLKKIGVEMPSVECPPSPRYQLVFAALTFYAILCGAYAFLAPHIAPWLQHSHLVKILLQPIEWPHFTEELAISAVQRTLSFVIPLAGGMFFYTERRLRYPSESSFQAFVVVFSVQFPFALLVNVVFAVVFFARSEAGRFAGDLSLLDLSLWTDAFLFSLTPAVALLSWILCGRIGMGRSGTIAVVCFAAAVAFCISQLLFEAMTSHITGFYWHQLVFGAFITVSYGMAALVANEVFPTIDGNSLGRRADRQIRTAAA